MKNKILLTIILFFSVTTATFAQELRIAVSNKPLDKVLTELNVELSFNSRALSAYLVTLNRNFSSPKQAIDCLLEGKPFECEKIGNVYVIYPKRSTSSQLLPRPKREFVFSGTLIDAETGEPLPYGYITTPRGMITSDNNGYFSFVDSDNLPKPIKTQYLGYCPIDTIISPGSSILRMQTRTVLMGEITIVSSPDLMTMQSGERSGENHINHRVAQYMPGSGDNSVFTLLRMMPGVRASGEPSEELIVWGDNSRIAFDGFTLFGMRGFNDNISFINPYMAKDIRLMKGGYDASYGGQIGGVAEITGVSGNMSKPTLKANISTLTANLYGSLPISKRSAISVAYRQTFYDLYESELLNPYNGKRPSSANSKGGSRPQQNIAEVLITPNYGFRDLNVKYSGEAFENDSYYISLYGADDKFDFTVESDLDTELSASQQNRQYGGATNYNRVWKNGSTTKLLFHFSQLRNDEQHIAIASSGQKLPSAYGINNLILESGIKLSHDLNLGEHNKLEMGGGVNGYNSLLNGDKRSLVAPSVFVTDNLSYGKFSADIGSRVGIIHYKTYVQPRISLKHKLSERVTATASWGLYKQYLNRIPVETESDKITFAWKLTDVTTSMQTITGVSYSNNGFLASAEGFSKQISNSIELFDGQIVATDVKLWGCDLFMKKNFLKATLFGSYSFLQTTFPKTEYGHEIKLGGLYSTKHFVFSANYVYGSGLSILNIGRISSGNGQGQSSQTSLADRPYSRFDVAATYRHSFNSCKLQVGFSVVNLFNTENIKYSYGTGSKNDPVALYSQATPFTPMLFVEILF